MKNRLDSVTTNTHMSRLPPEKKMPPARMANKSAQATYTPSEAFTDTRSLPMS